MVKRGGKDRPKKALTAYNIFLKEMKSLYGAKNLPFTEFSRLCSDRWRSLSPEEKQVFQEKADEDRERYLYEMQYFGPIKKKKIKRPLTAFIYFCQAERPKLKLKHPSWSGPQLVREIAKKWRESSATLKLKYNNLARKGWDKYRKQQKRKKLESKSSESSYRSDST